MRMTGVLIAVLAAIAGLPAVAVALSDWVRLEQPLGFAISYPASVFAPSAGSRADSSGHVLVSRDGRAQFLAATFDNAEGMSLAEYRQQLIDDNYASAKLDFAPVKRDWFILSGRQGATHFYYRVSFACRGARIDSWALIYPDSERSTYDRIVEAVARTYAPRRAGADCE